MTFDRKPDLDNANVGMPDTRISGIRKISREVTKSVTSLFLFQELNKTPKEKGIMKKTNTKKLAVAGVFCAVAVVGSLFSFPVFGSKCAPVQHMINILCAVLLGPGYGLGTLIGEVFGTAVLGGLCAYLVAVLFMGQSAAGLAFYAYIVPFLISTAAGAVISAVLIYSLKKTGVLHTMQETLNR